MKIAVRISDIPGGGEYNAPVEGCVASWQKNRGDHINQGDDLFEFESEKAVVTALAPVSGILICIMIPAGTIWHRGELLEVKDGMPIYDPPFCLIETDETSATVVAPEPQCSHPCSARHEHDSVTETAIHVEQKKIKPRMTMAALRLMGEEEISHKELFDFFGGDIAMFTEYDIKQLLEERDRSVQLRHNPVVVSDPSQKEMVRAVPFARSLAREKEIHLNDIQGTGPEGLILASDVEKKIGNKKVPEKISAQQSSAELSEEPILLTMPYVWRITAANMEAGIRIPTVDARTDSRRFNIRRLTELYGNSRQSFKKVWLPLMVAYARVLGNERFAIFNSYWHEEVDNKGNVTPYVAVRKYVHMGIAYDRGELPVIDLVNKTIKGERLRILTVRNANTRSLQDIISEVDHLFEAAAQKRFSLRDTSGYTAIFNNLGALRHHSGRSILTQGIASMFNLGLMNMESGEAVVQSVVDHRLIDGAKTAPFFIALYKELMHSVFSELEVLLLEKK